MTRTHTGFFRHFISGFAIGAVALVAAQFGVADTRMVHAAPATVERLG